MSGYATSLFMYSYVGYFTSYLGYNTYVVLYIEGIADLIAAVVFYYQGKILKIEQYFTFSSAFSIVCSIFLSYSLYEEGSSSSYTTMAIIFIFLLRCATMLNTFNSFNMVTNLFPPLVRGKAF